MSELVDQVKKEIEKQQQILKIVEEFDDLKRMTDRWNRSYLCSKCVNSIADHVQFGSSCGCCDDASFYAMPYVVRFGQRVYTYPYMVHIGRGAGYGGSGEIPFDNWRENLEKNKINPNIIEQVNQWFIDNPVKFYEDEDD